MVEEPIANRASFITDRLQHIQKRADIIFMGANDFNLILQTGKQKQVTTWQLGLQHIVLIYYLFFNLHTHEQMILLSILLLENWNSFPLIYLKVPCNCPAHGQLSKRSFASVLYSKKKKGRNVKASLYHTCMTYFKQIASKVGLTPAFTLW